MSDAPKDGLPEERAEEARNLAKEAVEAIKEGDREEGSFLAAEAKQLNKAAAEAVLKNQAAGKSQ